MQAHLVWQYKMTIPTRPAPAPPSTAAAGANASLERLRLQLEQQQQLLRQQQEQQEQEKNGGNKLLIKLPPPPLNRTNATNTSYYQPPLLTTRNIKNNIHASEDSSPSSITRKFPIARYAPATNWDDSPFDSFSNDKKGHNAHGSKKKVPPPRPPPPKVNMRKNVAPAPPISPRPPTSVNILSSIFNRKKQAKAAQSSRIYGLSAGVNNTNVGAWNTNNSASATAYNTFTPASLMNSAFETGNKNSTTTTTSINSNQEPQLISFDSPPSSPTFTQKSNSDCVSVDSFSSDSNFSSPNNGSASQAESGFEDDFSSVFRNRQTNISPLDPWETVGNHGDGLFTATTCAPVRNCNIINNRQSQEPNPLCNGKNLLPPAPSLQMPTIIKPKIAQKTKAPKPPSSYTNQSISPTNMSTNSKLQSKYDGAGVSLLDVISGRADALSLGKHNDSVIGNDNENQNTPYGIALYDFEGVEDGDLSFRENEKIYLLEQMSAEWYRGRVRSGCEGIFPINYIEVKIPLVTNSSEDKNKQNVAYQWPTAHSLYNFTAEVDGDLALQENDLITIYYKINDDWLYGEVNGRSGQFPANFIDAIPVNLAPMPQS